MTAAVSSARLTPEDLLCLEEDGLYELVDGKLVEMKMSYLANLTAGRVITVLSNFVAPANLGDVLPEQTFRCFPGDPDRVRRPDVAFILASRTPRVPAEGHISVAPDIAVEVVSSSDRICDLDEKLADYRAAGIRLVWVMNPNSRTIRVHRPDHTVTELAESDILRGESVLPDFAVRVWSFCRRRLPARRNANE